MIQPDHIPMELRGLAQWCRWKYVQRGEDKPTKVPVQINGKMAKSNDPATWTTLDAAMESSVGDGIGFVFVRDDGLVGIDFDNALDEEEALKPWAEPLVKALNSYTEISPSGLGVKVWARGRYSGPKTGERVDYADGKLEMYCSGRYFTVTGVRFPGTPATINEAQGAIDRVYAEIETAKKVAKPERTQNNSTHSPERSTIDVVERCRRYIAKLPDAVSGHNGHDKTFHASAVCARFGLTEDQTQEVMQAFNECKCVPVWTDAELAHKISDARNDVIREGTFGSLLRSGPPKRKAGQKQNRRKGAKRIDTEVDDAAPSHCTDAANAARFATMHGEDVRFTTARGWLYWDGNRWKPDSIQEIERRAKQTARTIYQEAVEESDLALRQELAEWAVTSESEPRIRAMIALARSEPGIAVEVSAFDAQPMFFNCLNGTIDLRTGELREQRREDLLTKISPVKYDADARSESWEKLLSDTTQSDLELYAFLGRAVGYSMTGSVAEESLFFVHGPTASGKSTCIEAVRAAFGDYALTADFETFLKRRASGSPRNDIARLAGSRFVVSIEVDEGRKLAEGLIKSITGGDTVAARFLFKESFEFRPPFKLWLVANHAPHVSADDGAMWRRILRIPFDRTVPEDQRDPTLKARLMDPVESGPAILAWAVRGCLDWQEVGLAVPERVRAATAAYRADEDIIAQYVEEQCEIGPAEFVSATVLYANFKSWSTQRGEKPMTQTAFGRSLEDHGYNKDRQGGTGAIIRRGLTLARHAAEETL